MNTKLLVDAGSSKIEWVLLTTEGRVVADITTHGVNALIASAEEIEKNFSGVASQFPPEVKPQEIYYYGAGCSTPALCKKIEGVLGKIWPSASKITVTTDMLGACHALLGKDKGIVCILGTGSNSCLYTGEEIEQNIPSLGYILGDEGSGTALGKRLVSDAFKGHLPPPIRDKFMSYYQLTLESILEYTYRRPGANRFLASLVPFIKDHIWNPYLYSLVLEEFTSFLKRNIALYTGARTLPLVFTGSVAYHFSDILTEAADRQGFKIMKIEKAPMAGLISYHVSADENSCGEK